MARVSSAPHRSSRVTKRKRGNEHSIHRKMAQNLHVCADVGDSLTRLQRSLQQQFVQYKTQKARADELSRLFVVTEQLIHFEMLFGSEMQVENLDTAKTRSLRKRLDQLLTQLSNQKKPRTQKVCKNLPCLVKKATLMVTERRLWVKEQEELPARHQWVPMVLWNVYEEVAQMAEKDATMKPLKSAMHQVMKTLNELNPFFYLQVLYQPPPSHLNGRWEIQASKKLTEITASMTPYFRELKRRSFALSNTQDMNARISYGWNHLRFTLVLAKRAARHFHYLVLHLYAVAMGCEPANVHAGIISEKAARGLISDEQELRAHLGLSSDSSTSDDSLLKQSFEWTPELLAFVDEWRWHERRRVGFDRREHHRDFLPRFLFDERRNRPKARCDVLGEVGYWLREVERVWRKSRLGSTRFIPMTIEDIGVLEKRIKGGLGAVVDLVYKMMLARWMDRRKRPDKWWASLELRQRLRLNSDMDFQMDLPEAFLQEHSEEAQAEVTEGSKSESIANEDVQDATDAESVEHKEVRRTRVDLPAEGNFRRPTKAWLLAPEDPTVEELQESVRSAHHHVAELLSRYDGEHSTEWHNTILSTGLGTAQLLRMISRDEAAH